MNKYKADRLNYYVLIYKHTKDNRYFNKIYNDIKEFIIYKYAKKLNNDYREIEYFFDINIINILRTSIKNFNIDYNKGNSSFIFYINNIFNLRYINFLKKHYYKRRKKELSCSNIDYISDFDVENKYLDNEYNMINNKFIYEFLLKSGDKKSFSYFLEIYTRYLRITGKLTTDESYMLAKKYCNLQTMQSRFRRLAHGLNKYLKKRFEILDINKMYNSYNNILHILHIYSINNNITDEIVKIIKNRDEDNYNILIDKCKQVYNQFLNGLKENSIGAYTRFDFHNTCL